MPFSSAWSPHNLISLVAGCIIRLTDLTSRSCFQLTIAVALPRSPIRPLKFGDFGGEMAKGKIMLLWEEEIAIWQALFIKKEQLYILPTKLPFTEYLLRRS